jgi:TonB family protein
MRRSATSRQRVIGRVNWLGTFGLASIGHAALLWSLLAPLTTLGAGAHAATATAAAGPAVEPLDTTCAGDALLAAAAAAVTCESPLADAGCDAAVRATLDADLAHCRGDDAPLEFAMLDPAQVAHLTPIDPEPLLESITPEAQAAFEAKQEAAQAAQAAEVERQKQQPPKDMQVVETAKPALEVEPDQARFVSEYNTKVDRETVARGSRQEAMIDRPQPSVLPTKPNAADPAIAKPPPDRPDSLAERAPDAPGKLSMRAPGSLAPSESPQEAKVRGALTGDTGPAGDGAAARRGDGAIEQARRDPTELAPGQGGAGGGAPHLPNLRPSDDQLSRVVGGGSVDHYDDVEEGEVTAVSSRQWVGATFMNRTKRLVAQEWNPAEAWAHFDPRGSVYGYKTRITVLRVTLSPDGALTKAVVIQGSGVDFLDDEAVRAFKAASPFPNPPDVLRGDDGLITFTFGFYFEISGGRSNWKIFRQ